MNINNNLKKISNKINIDKLDLKKIDDLITTEVEKTGVESPQIMTERIHKKDETAFLSWLDSQYVSTFQEITSNDSQNNNSINVKNIEALNNAIKQMGLRETSCKGVYCQQHNPDMPAGNYTHQKHYVWNDSKQEMIEIPEVYYISPNGNQAKGKNGYEEILAYQLGYEFTDTVGIYKKEEQLYTFNTETSTFVPYKEKFDSSILQNIIKQMGLRETSCKGVYCQQHNPDMPDGNYTHQKHYVWNPTKQEMVEIPDVYYIDKKGYLAKGKNGYEEILAYQLDYEFTDTIGIYQKDGQSFTFNLETSTFVPYNEFFDTSIFPDNEAITPASIMQNISKMLNSEDTNTVKFAQKLNELFKTFNINNNYDQEDMIKSLIVVMNNTAGVKNSYPLELNKGTLIKLNQTDIFEELDKIINSDELKNEYYCGVDGYIDNFGQGGTGDCWLLAGIISLNASEAGKQIIKDSISTDENGNIVVTFKGIGLSYTITPEEMVEARESYAYSNGDNDVQAIELAVEKLYRQIANNEIGLPYGNGSSGEMSDDWKSGLLYANRSEFLLFYLTGNTQQSSRTGNETVIEYLNSIYDDLKNGKVAGYFDFRGGESATTIDGTNFKYNGGAHALAIVGMTEDTITIVNPWNSDQPITFSWEEFAKLPPGALGVTSTKLNEREYNNYNCDNTINYDAKFNIDGKEYSINDILGMDTLPYKGNTLDMVIQILDKAFSNVEPSMKNELVRIFDCFYNNLCQNNIDRSCIYDQNYEYCYHLDKNMCDDFGVINSENGFEINVKELVQKLLEYAKIFMREPMDLTEYNKKLSGDELNKEVSEIELNQYAKEYIEELFKDLTSQFDYNEDFINLIKKYVRNEYNNSKGTDRDLFNLKDYLIKIKEEFDMYIKPSSEIILSSDVNFNAEGITYIAMRIIESLYLKNEDNIQAEDINDFKQKLFEYIANNYGMKEEYEKNGTINLANLINFDKNEDGNWLDDFYQIAEDFSHIDDNAIVDYYKKFNINGHEYTINQILESKYPIKVTIYDMQYLNGFIYNYIGSFSDVLKNIPKEQVNNIINTLESYYITFCNSSLDRNNLYNGCWANVKNYITGEDEKVVFTFETAMEYGINNVDNVMIELDLKVIAQKFLELVELVNRSGFNPTITQNVFNSQFVHIFAQHMHSLHSLIFAKFNTSDRLNFDK